MSFLITGLRRSIWIVLIGAVGGAGVAWWRDRNAPLSPSSPPEWPPLVIAPAETPVAAPTATPAATPAAAPSAARSEPSARATPTGTSSTGTGSVVNALVDAPEARSAAGTGAWIEPGADGSCPPSHPIKANDNSGIFHVPGGRFYERTNPERCYATPADAIADGYRQAKA